MENTLHLIHFVQKTYQLTNRHIRSELYLPETKNKLVGKHELPQ